MAIAGSIVYVSLKNFMTYNSFEWYPKPGLNIILGPNGTGKSALSCAICLALGCSLNIMGRASKISDFIKSGKNECVIIVEIFNPEGINWKIKRTITHVSSNFEVNGKRVVMKEVNKLTDSLNIQLDNYCQFLPQDKVSDFVKMNSSALLRSTEQAIDRTIYQQHNDLVAKSVDYSAIGVNLEKLNSKINELRKLNQMASDEVVKLKEHKSLMNQIHAYSVLKRIKQYTSEHTKYEKCLQSISSKSDKLLKDMKKATQLRNKYNSNLDAFNKELQLLKGKQHQLHVEFPPKIETILDQYSSSSAEFNSIMVDFVERCNSLDKLKSDVDLLGKQREMLECDLNANDYVKLKEMCLASDDECKEKKLNLKAVDDGVVKINNRLAELKTLQNALKRKVDMRDTALQRRSELIKSKFPDVYQACLWLDNNSSSFVGQWFKPAALCLSVDKELSKYLQCAVPRRDLFAMFFFEHVMDLSKFLTQCQDSQKLVVNASLIEMSNDENDTSSMEIDNIRKYGFTNYLVDVVNGPKPVIKYLCRHFAIQRIPIGSNSTNQYVREIIEKIPQLFLFFTDVWMYRVVKSRHTGKVSSNSSRIPNDCILASMHVPSNSDHTVEKQQHMTLQSKLKSIYTEKEECIAKRIEVVNILKSAEENKNKLYQQLKFKEIVRLKIKRIKSRIDCIHRQMFNVKDEEKLVAGKRCRIAMQCNKYLHTMFDTLKTVVQIQSEISEIESKLSETKHAVTTEEIELRLFTDSLDRLKIVVSDLKASANELKMALRAQLREIISMSSKTETNLVLSREELKKNIICPSILLKQFKCVHIKANSISEITCFDIDHKIAELQTRASLISDVDVTVLEEYEKREEAIHKFESDRDVIKEQLDALHSEIDSIKIEWMSNVQRLVDKINMHFVGFFKELICAGKVLLNVPADQMKFSDYGIDIQVQFRKESAMRSLSFGFQSGGERSVATMLYLLSLQFCVTCPFRLVDELNQGMDESNERTIMELVVKTVSNSGNQYFLISPKLVKDLSYNGDNVSVTVLCKSNSNYSFKSLRFKKKDDIEKETI